MRRVPTNSFYATLSRDIAAAFASAGENDVASFEAAFARYVGVRRAFLVGSGTSALYVILKALRTLSTRNEVVLPAYMVPTLTLAIARAGLVTRLCDIDRATLNMDPGRLDESVNRKTLAVVPAHLFGFPMDLGAHPYGGSQRLLFRHRGRGPGAGGDPERPSGGGIGRRGLFFDVQGQDHFDVSRRRNHDGRSRHRRGSRAGGAVVTDARPAL